MFCIADRTAYTGRLALRKRGAYIVVREAHKVETDDKVSVLHLKTDTDIAVDLRSN